MEAASKFKAAEVPRVPDAGVSAAIAEEEDDGEEVEADGEKDIPSFDLSVSLVDAIFTGLKDFHTNAGYPDNDGFEWKHYQKKKKNMSKLKCTRCSASKFKFKRKTQLRQTRFDARNGSLTVKYELPYAYDCQPYMENIKLLL